jgi:pyruvate dehydrogenase E2 component (dihydrolipoyllysine-residue acetyltransferase)
MSEVTMPKLTDTMEEGTILRWVKQVGERVEPGEILAEVETDKADMELEVSRPGVLKEIKFKEGDTVPVGAVIAVLSADGEGAPPSPTPRGREKPEDHGEAEAEATGSEAAQEQRARATPAPEQQVSPSRKIAAFPTEGEENDDIAGRARSGVQPPRVSHASPLARRTATQRGVDVRNVRGTGPGGRVTRRDVVAARTESRPDKDASGAQLPQKAGRIELSKMRRSIAHRMAEAKREVPHFYLRGEIDMSEAMRLRASLDATGVLREPVSVTHLLIKAVAVALQRHPRLNAAWDDGAIKLSESINIGIATAVDDGLLVPVLKGCERLSLVEIAAAARKLNQKARGGLFTSEEMLGGTFTISNMGMLDVDDFSAIINPPQAAILAVGTAKERPVVRDGHLAVAETMYVTLSCDHRVLNGVEAAKFLAELKRLLENPVALVMSQT